MTNVRFAAAVGILVSSLTNCNADERPFLGAWSFELPDGSPVWLKIAGPAETPTGTLLWSVGSAKPVRDLQVKPDSITFTRHVSWKPDGGSKVLKVTSPFLGTLAENKLQLHFKHVNQDAPANTPEVMVLTGQRIPDPPPKPDLTKVRFGAPVHLFNGKNLNGWRISNPNKKNGWRADEGCLVNSTPKKDFSAYGDYGNLVTTKEFRDFELTIEYNVEAGGNSGIYLRGMYEAQVVDRDSKMQGIQGPGAIFGRIAPSGNVARPGGEWNRYVLTLVDRHVTVSLNGTTVIDNQLLEGCTGGGLQSDDTKAGPLFLQGDHTSVKYRNIVLRPVISGSDADESAEIWNLNKLVRTPESEWIDNQSPIRSLLYRGEHINGQPTRVFAFYATPGTLKNDVSKDHDLPAVVLVHGGGGTAFAEWVRMWAERGYAAIAMDLSGRRPETPIVRNGALQIQPNGGSRTRLADGGPEQGAAQKFASVGDDVSSHWPFHAVSNVIRAHSLIRSFPETDPARTAITGISWGGYTTCITASVDNRFKAAVPVYGCGFLYDGESVQRSSIDALPTPHRETWIQRYDPSSHLSKCTVPMLFVNGTNDKHYPLKSYSRSYQLVPEKYRQIRIEVNMRHSHQAGWEPTEIFRFIDSHLGTSDSLPILRLPEQSEKECRVRYSAARPLKSAALNFTTDSGPLLSRQWQSVAAEFDEQTIRSDDLPQNATIWFFSATDDLDGMTSTDVRFNTVND